MPYMASSASLFFSFKSDLQNFYKDYIYTIPTFTIKTNVFLFVCAEVLRPSQHNEVMSSAVSLSNHTASLVLQAVNQYCAHPFVRN